MNTKKPFMIGLLLVIVIPLNFFNNRWMEQSIVRHQDRYNSTEYQLARQP